MSALTKQTAELSLLPLLVCTRSAITPDNIVEETRRLKKREKINLVVVDHMQLMESSGETRGDYEKFTAISFQRPAAYQWFAGNQNVDPRLKSTFAEVNDLHGPAGGGVRGGAAPADPGAYSAGGGEPAPAYRSSAGGA